MRIDSLISNFGRLVRDFRSANAGNVALTFAIATLPVIGGVGAAVDYSHANSVKAALQASLDSTALLLAKEAANDSAATLNANALKYFQALFTRSEAKNITITATYTASGGSQVVVNGSADVPTSFMGIMGYNKITVQGTSTTKWGSSRLRVALVLDNTGSMGQYNKLTALKSATNSLLTQLQAAAGTNGDVYVSIVPFVKDVNVGAANYNSNYLYWGTLLQDPTLSDDNSWDAQNGSCSKNNQYDRPSCKNKNGTWTPNNHNTWNGCVMDRGNSSGPDTINNYDTNAGGTSVLINSSLYAAEQYAYCPDAAVMALTYDWTALTNLVNSMTANGNTNQGIGLQLGWMSLVGGGPFPTPPAMDPNYKYTQVVILLTDGLNTENRWTTSQTSIDTRQQLTCNNIKAAGITLYTIQVNTDGDPTSTLLQNCASDSTKFFLLTSSTQIVGVFNQIGTNLSQLRVAK